MRAASLPFIIRIRSKVPAVAVRAFAVAQETSDGTTPLRGAVSRNEKRSSYTGIPLHLSVRRHDEKLCRAVRSAVPIS